MIEDEILSTYFYEPIEEKIRARLVLIGADEKDFAFHRGAATDPEEVLQETKQTAKAEIYTSFPGGDMLLSEGPTVTGTFSGQAFIFLNTRNLPGFRLMANISKACNIEKNGLKCNALDFVQYGRARQSIYAITLKYNLSVNI